MLGIRHQIAARVTKFLLWFCRKERLKGNEIEGKISYRSKITFDNKTQ